MQKSLAPSSELVIDVNLGIWAILPGLPSANVNVLPRYNAWRESGTTLLAPALWLAEATTAIRSLVYIRHLTKSEGLDALDNVLKLDVELTPLTAELCRRALAWAERLQQAKAYDGFYLALADERGCEFWTADRRLANGARQAGAANVHWIGES